MYQDVRHLKICASKGIRIEKISTIIDFGCGDGERVYQLRDLGYDRTYGYNKSDYMGEVAPAKLRHPSDRQWFRYSSNGTLPWMDNSVDLIISDQVFEHVRDQEMAFVEQYRVLKRGGTAVHIIPAKWRIIEPHIMVPLGGLNPFKERWWFYLWARLGVRNHWQKAKGTSAEVVAAENAHYARTCLNYLSCRQYRRLLSRIGFSHTWEESLYMAQSSRPQIRALAKVPFAASLIRTFVQRALLLRK